MADEAAEHSSGAAAPIRPGELTARILSAVILAGVALAAAAAGGAVFTGLVIVLAGVMSWEWGRIVRQGHADQVVTGLHAFAAAAAGLLAAAGQPLLGVVATGIGAAVVLVLAHGSQARWSGAGVLYVGLPAVALIWIRNAEPDGMRAILFLFAIVWTTDTFSYVCGKLIGGAKLWPWLSPNKTWAGTIGGVVCAALAAVVFALATSHPAPGAIALTGLILAIASQSGDLGESALKRAFNVRNASNLIPGHGGCMDRMDGIVVAATVAALLAAFRNVDQPAAALLHGL